MPYPYRIDATLGPQPSSPWGPDKLIIRGSTLYQPLYDYVSGPDKIAMMQSTDAGVTWAEMDSSSSNRPEISSIVDHNQFAIFDDGEVVYFAHVNSANTASVISKFNTTGDTWQTPITGGPLPVDAPAGSTTSSTKSQLNIAVRSNGDIVLIYTTESGTSHNLKFMVYSGGSWGSANDFLIAGTTDAAVTDYAVLASVLGDNDRLHVFGWTIDGYVYARIESDNTVTGYKRFNENSQNGYLFGSRNCWGAGQMVTLCGVRFAAFPLMLSLSGSDVFKPVLWLFKDTGSFTSRTQFAIEDTSAVNYDWLSVSVSQDASTGAIYFAWLKEDPDGSADFKVRMSCFKGADWSDPVTLFTFDWTTYHNTQTMEITASDGIMRIVALANDTGVWYWQAAASCSATGCGVSSGNINSVR